MINLINTFCYHLVRVVSRDKQSHQPFDCAETVFPPHSGWQKWKGHQSVVRKVLSLRKWKCCTESIWPFGRDLEFFFFCRGLEFIFCFFCFFVFFDGSSKEELLNKSTNRTLQIATELLPSCMWGFGCVFVADTAAASIFYLSQMQRLAHWDFCTATVNSL